MQQYILVSVLCMSLVGAVSMVSLANEPDNTFCRNNANALTQHDSPGASKCVIQASINVYSCLACAYGFTIQSVDLFIKVVMLRRGVSYWKVHIVIIFLFPVISVVGLGLWGTFGFDRY